MFKCVDNEKLHERLRESKQSPFAFFVMNDAQQLTKEIVEKSIFFFFSRTEIFCTLTVTAQLLHLNETKSHL
jgi:hypothetical protein